MRDIALSTARLVSEVRRIRSRLFPCFKPLRTSCQISSAIAVDLPVPGGPWITAISSAKLL